MLEALRKSQIIVKTLTFLYQFAVAGVWIYENIVRPVTRPFRRLALCAWRKYREVWEKVVYTKDGYFSKTRAGVFLSGTIAFLYILPQLLYFTWLALVFAVTVEREVVYLTQSQEIYPERDVHSVKGCESLPCSDANALYYRIEPSMFNQAWSMVWRRQIFYPDYVAAAVPPGVSKCRVLSYGFRMKFMMRQMDIYPDILEVSCDYQGEQR